MTRFVGLDRSVNPLNGLPFLSLADGAGAEVGKDLLSDVGPPPLLSKSAGISPA